MNSSVAMVVTELDGRFFLCNDNFTRLTGCSRYSLPLFGLNQLISCFFSQNINSKTIYDCVVPEEVPHLFTTFHQLSSSLSQLDEPYQTLATFQFSKTSIPIQCSVTVWMFEHLSNPQSLYFQLILLPLSEEIGNGQSVAPSSATSSTSTSVGTNLQLAAHFPSPSSTGTTFVASHLHPLPLLPSTPVLVPEESESSSKQCQSPISIFEGEDVKSPDESFRSSYAEASSFFIPSYQFSRSIPNPYPHSQNPTYGFPYSSSEYLASASYQPSPSPHHAAGGMAQYDQDESDDTFENMPENWFEQDGEEDPEDDS
jgi:hypothetical protein